MHFATVINSHPYTYIHRHMEAHLQQLHKHNTLVYTVYIRTTQLFHTRLQNICFQIQITISSRCMHIFKIHIRIAQCTGCLLTNNTCVQRLQFGIQIQKCCDVNFTCICAFYYAPGTLTTRMAHVSIWLLVHVLFQTIIIIVLKNKRHTE